MFLHAIIPKVASQWMDKTMTPNVYSTGARGEYVCPVMDQHGIALALYPKPPWCEKTVKESMLVGWWPIVYNSVQRCTTMYNDVQLWWPIVYNAYRAKSRLKVRSGSKIFDCILLHLRFILSVIDHHARKYSAETVSNNSLGLFFQAWFSSQPRFNNSKWFHYYRFPVTHDCFITYQFVCGV